MEAGENTSTGDSATSASMAAINEPTLDNVHADPEDIGDGKTVQPDLTKTKRSSAAAKSASSAKRLGSRRSILLNMNVRRVSLFLCHLNLCVLINGMWIQFSYES